VPVGPGVLEVTLNSASLNAQFFEFDMQYTVNSSTVALGRVVSP